MSGGRYSAAHLAPQAMTSGAAVTSGAARRGPVPHLGGGRRLLGSPEERSIWLGGAQQRRIGDPNISDGTIATPRHNIFAGLGQTMARGSHAAHTPHWSGPIWAAAGYGADPPPEGADAAQKIAAIYSNPLMVVLRLASTGISAYHGYKRNNSVGWALWWGFMGSMFPIVTPAIAFAQGIDKPKGR